MLFQTLIAGGFGLLLTATDDAALERLAALRIEAPMAVAAQVVAPAATADIKAAPEHCPIDGPAGADPLRLSAVR